MTVNKLSNLKHFNRSSATTKIFLSLLSFGFIFFTASESKVFGQLVTSFLCYGNSIVKPNYCKSIVWNGQSIANANFVCGGTTRGWITATNNTTCPNGANLGNYSLVRKFTNYCDGYVESDSYGAVLRTSITGAQFCSGGFTNAVTHYYEEGCYNIVASSGGCNSSPNWGTYPTTGCASGFVYNGEYCTRSDAFINQCENQFFGYSAETCGCNGGCQEGGSCSPVLIDVLGNGFDLTDAANGVDFDVDGNGTAERRAWTLASSDDAWLVLDRNGNGMIDNGRELFGSACSQPPPPSGIGLNGFNALGEYDKAGFGGNGDGIISQLDIIFSSLKLWRDTNHNGISETNELHTFQEIGLNTIDVDYHESRRTDEFGNEFKYRAKVKDAQGAQIGRWAWDVFLVTGN